MALKFGNTTVKKVICNGTECTDVWFNNTQVYKKRILDLTLKVKTSWNSNERTHPTSEPTIPDVVISVGSGGVTRSVTITDSAYSKGAAVFNENGAEDYSRICTANTKIPIYDTETVTINIAGWCYTWQGTEAQDYATMKQPQALQAYVDDNTSYYNRSLMGDYGKTKISFDVSENVNLTLGQYDIRHTYTNQVVYKGSNILEMRSNRALAISVS